MKANEKDITLAAVRRLFVLAVLVLFDGLDDPF
jgi:hypothetical protein